MTGDLLLAKEVAEWLSVSVRTVLGWARRGDLATVRLPGGQIRFPRADVERWLKEHQHSAASGSIAGQQKRPGDAITSPARH